MPTTTPKPTGAASKERIYRQIENTAGFYPPATYGDLLSFYDDFALGADPASGQFYPLSQVNRLWGQQSILFAIGVIPPSANVTGRLLDRTASIPLDGAVEPAGEEEVNQAAAQTPTGMDPVTSKGGKSAQLHRNARQIILEAFRELYGRDPTLEELQYGQAIGWVETNYGGGWKGDMVGSNNWGAVHCPKSAQTGPGCISFTDKYSDGTPYTVSFRSYKTPKDGAKDLLANVFTKRGTSGGVNGGSVYRGSYEMRRGTYYGGFCPNATKEYGGRDARASLKSPDQNAGTAACAQEAVASHANLVKQIINDIAGANGDPGALGLGNYADADAWWREKEGVLAAGSGVGPDASSGDWQGKGSKNSKTAKEEEQQIAGSPLLASELGKKLLAAQANQIAATQAAIDAMSKTPPLAMLVNPASFSVKGEKIVNDGNWGRNGPIIEYWGDQQDKISASGKVAGFFAIDVLNANGPGVTRWARNFSAAWQNFQSLYALYRSNGALFLPDDTTQGKTLNLSMLGSIYIFYDNTLYIGSFDSFSITENDTAPHTVEYSFEFTVRSAYLLDRTDDAFDYGISSLLPKDTAPMQAPAAVPDSSDEKIPTPPIQEEL